jgi:hypothetical protein
MSIDQKIRMGLFALAVAGAIISALLGVSPSALAIISVSDLSSG